ncbi:polysaccharide pyruvyl transferase family protein [Marisediminicola sp. LYQ85]|uniref:polysaccharide pyruvyl transferase family protein n=1 Tax=Marisediminicola sp. LYQ85 TaxID=3391062 RepID=UPI0039836E71
MRILVLWAGASNPNLGVRALARGSHDLLRQVWPDAEFHYADFGQRPRQLPWGRVRSLVRERATGALGMQKWLGSFDLVWDTRSGDSFSDIYGLGRLTVMSSIHEFAAQAGAKVVMAPQTIGPFRTRRGRALARRTLSRSSLVFARDPISADAARALGRPVDATVSDLVFGIDAPAESTPRDVIINVSGLLWNENRHVDFEAYRRTIRAVIAGLLDAGRTVTLLPHVLDSGNPDNDVPTSREIAREFGAGVDIHVPLDLDDARSVISGATVLIGARMHACLNALSTGVPAVAMAYSRKFDPLMRAIDWPHVVTLDGADEAARAILEIVSDPALAERARRSRALATELVDSSVTLLRSLD